MINRVAGKYFASMVSSVGTHHETGNFIDRVTMAEQFIQLFLLLIVLIDLF